MPNPENYDNFNEWMEACVPVVKAEGKTQKQAIGQCAGMWEDKEGTNNMPKKLQTLTSNFKPLTRNDTMEGQEYLVAPMVMLTEGVHKGSGGALYYPNEELAKTPAVWNHKPVVVYHPEGSACDPDILTNRKIGIIMNTKFEDGKLKAEAWLNVNRIKQVDDRIFDAIENNEMMELSTGLWTDNEQTEGEWSDEKYDAIARNYRPDHLAILPDLEGACSIADGAGFLRLNVKDDGKINVSLEAKPDTSFTSYMRNNKQNISRAVSRVIRNEISFDDIHRTLNGILHDKFQDEEYVWVEAVFEDYFIYQRDGSLYKQKYIESEGNIKLEGVAVEVVKEVSYPEKSLTSNSSQRKKKGSIMNINEFVKKLIDNEKTHWTEDDEEFLKNQDEETLKKFAPVENEEDPKESEEEEKKPEANKEPENTENQEAEKNEKMTVDEYISKAPPEMRDVLRNGLNSYKSEKSKLVESIISNERNTFTKEQLDAKDLDELKALAALAVNSKTEHGEPRYDGQSDPAMVDNDNVQEALGLPTMNFDDEK